MKRTIRHSSTTCTVPGCELCEQKLPFTLPPHLLKAAADSRLVIFAGAGISTEHRSVFANSFRNDVAGELNLPTDGLSFPEVMSRFVDQPDGRSKLLLKIRERIDYVRSHPELYWIATRFHNELATIWQINEIITTNWDDFFERRCGATPFITDMDLAFWSQPGRKVLKLHGSIHSLGEMVVTANDYDRCYERLSTGVLGSRLKTLLSDRTIVFVGYSLADPDLQRIISALTTEMRGLRPTAYIVTPDAVADLGGSEADIRHIKTDGTHFLGVLKAELQKSHHTIPDKSFGRLATFRPRLHKAHRELLLKRPESKYPETIYCGSYHDGIFHSIDRAMNLANTGQYSHRCVLMHKIRHYEKVRIKQLRRRSYYDVAYVDGYITGLILLTADDDLSKDVPLFYVFGARNQPVTFAAYSRLARRARRLHRDSYMKAKKVAKKSGHLESHHRPFLDASVDGEEDVD